MSLKRLIKQNAKTVMGVDSSTNSFAFCVMSDNPEKWGKINFQGNNIYEKIIDCRNKMQFVRDEVKPDYICIESAIMVRSSAVAIHMAMMVGCLISELALEPNRIITVTPSEWQNYIGNKNLTKQEKLDIQREFPGKSESWYRNSARNLRKQRTLDYFNNKFGMKLTDNDVGDACGLAYYGWKKLVSHG